MLLRTFVCGLVAVLALVLLPSVAGASAPPPIEYQATVMQTFVSSAGNSVYYRRGYYLGGGSGFGRDKVHIKHGITNDEIIRKAVAEPQEIFQDRPEIYPARWVHRKEAFLVGIFGAPERVVVRVIIDYHGWSGPGQFGIVTAYCEGYSGLCPEWINRAF